MSLFEAIDVSVSYGAVKALDGVSISLEPGIVHGVIGPNGAGKSTFIDGLSGRTRLTGGRVMLDGENVTARRPAWRRHRGISRSFQRTSVFPAMTVGDQFDMVADRMNEEDLDGIVDALQLRGVLAQVCSEIAYGTQRSVDLALALIGRPRVVLLDEPCAGLVADEGVTMLNHIRTLCKERDVAAILVEHDVDGVFRTCDEVTVLDLGRILVSGKPGDVRKDERVIRAYLGSAG